MSDRVVKHINIFCVSLCFMILREHDKHGADEKFWKKIKSKHRALKSLVPSPFI